MTYDLSELNQMNRSQFTDVLGSIFEQTPSIAFESWNHRPFKDFDALYQSMVDILWQMSSEQQLALIRSHPDLGSRLKMAEFSVQEQSGIGLDRLSPEQFEKFQALNQQYRDRFDFPFIIAVKNHTQDSILQAFSDRVYHSLETEFKQALVEILEIAKFRLKLLVPLTKINLGRSLRINGDRLMTRIFELAKIGRLPNSGVCRLAFTKEDILAREQITHWMQDAGMTVRVDAAGNLIGRYAGSGELAALATGSHIDTVPVGGKYDGCLGVIAGIELVQTLKDHNLRLQHPIEVIVFSDEERSVIGCKAMSGGIVDGPDRKSVV